jgi:GT2 family glycosyltransferase
LIKNNQPKGSGENHNFVFDLIKEKFFCVLNPDIQFVGNPFLELLKTAANSSCGIVAPMITDLQGVRADTMRQHLTPWGLFKRLLGFNSGIHSNQPSGCLVSPDWVAGMFMLMRSEVFNQVGGFDQKYFMYCEDADICRRVSRVGYQIIGCLNVSAVHAAQRASHRNLQHFLWHSQSLLRYFLVYGNCTLLKRTIPGKTKLM